MRAKEGAQTVPRGVYCSRAAAVCGAAGWWGAPGNRVASIAVDTGGPKPRRAHQRDKLMRRGAPTEEVTR